MHAATCWIRDCRHEDSGGETVIDTIQDTISAVLKERALDWRTCFAAVRAEPPDAKTIVIECSDGEVLGRVRVSLAERGFGGGGEIAFVELPSVREDFPELFIAATSVADVRRYPAHASELLTQLVYGDAVAPLKQEGDWIMVRLDDGYIGWVRTWHLRGTSWREHDAYGRKVGHRVRDNVIQVYEAPDDGSLPVSDAVVGTPVIVEPCDRRGWRRVTLPDGKRGFARGQSLEKRPGFERRRGEGAPSGGEDSLDPAKPVGLEPKSEPCRVPRRTRAGLEALRHSLRATALRFLGVPYVWGGTTPKGFDCSGLTQRVFRLHGIVIPRDSDMQARFGRVGLPGDVHALPPGGLLFFGKTPSQITHVGLYLQDGLFVHAHGQVRITALVPTHPLFDERLTLDWQLISDLL
jgi:hypothetical protein